MGAAARHVVPGGGALIMRRRLIAALTVAALIIVFVSGCHLRVTAHAGPAVQTLPRIDQESRSSTASGGLVF